MTISASYFTRPEADENGNVGPSPVEVDVTIIRSALVELQVIAGDIVAARSPSGQVIYTPTQITTLKTRATTALANLKNAVAALPTP